MIALCDMPTVQPTQREREWRSAVGMSARKKIETKQSPEIILSNTAATSHTWLLRTLEM